jgi:hypothetical protein
VGALSPRKQAQASVGAPTSSQINGADLQGFFRRAKKLPGLEYTRFVFLVAIGVEGHAPCFRFSQAAHVPQPAHVQGYGPVRFLSINVAKVSPEPDPYLRSLVGYDLWPRALGCVRGFLLEPEEGFSARRSGGQIPTFVLPRRKNSTNCNQDARAIGLFPATTRTARGARRVTSESWMSV